MVALANSLLFMIEFSLWCIAFLFLPFLVCRIIAKRMVKNRSFLAKRYVIGYDKSETINQMIQIANNILAGKDFPHENCYNINMFMCQGTIKKVKVETPRTEVTVSKDGKTAIFKRSYSEKEAISLIALVILAYAIVFCVIVAIIVRGQIC